GVGAGKIRHHAHHERHLYFLLGAVHLDVVFDLHARCAVACDELLTALLGHATLPFRVFGFRNATTIGSGVAWVRFATGNEESCGECGARKVARSSLPSSMWRPPPRCRQRPCDDASGIHTATGPHGDILNQPWLMCLRLRESRIGPAMRPPK